MHNSILSHIKYQNYVTIKMYGYAFRGSNPVIDILASLLKRDLLSKERICSKRGVYSQRKEFAPHGANCFFSEKTPVWKGYVS